MASQENTSVLVFLYTIMSKYYICIVDVVLAVIQFMNRIRVYTSTLRVYCGLSNLAMLPILHGAICTPDCSFKTLKDVIHGYSLVKYEHDSIQHLIGLILGPLSLMV